jgi:hypothetical protein
VKHCKCKCRCAPPRIEWGDVKWFLSWDAPDVVKLHIRPPGILSERDALNLAHCLMEAAGKCKDYAR